MLICEMIVSHGETLTYDGFIEVVDQEVEEFMGILLHVIVKLD